MTFFCWNPCPNSHRLISVTIQLQININSHIWIQIPHQYPSFNETSLQHFSIKQSSSHSSENSPVHSLKWRFFLTSSRKVQFIFPDKGQSTHSLKQSFFSTPSEPVVVLHAWFPQSVLAVCQTLYSDYFGTGKTLKEILGQWGVSLTIFHVETVAADRQTQVLSSTISVFVTTQLEYTQHLLCLRRIVYFFITSNLFY